MSQQVRHTETIQHSANADSSLGWVVGRGKELLFFIVALKFLFSSNQIQFKQERKPAYRQQFIEISSNQRTVIIEWCPFVDPNVML